MSDGSDSEWSASDSESESDEIDSDDQLSDEDEPTSETDTMAQITEEVPQTPEGETSDKERQDRRAREEEDWLMFGAEIALEEEQEETDELIEAMEEEENQEAEAWGEQWTGDTRDERHGTARNHKTLPEFVQAETRQRPDGVWIQKLRWADRDKIPSQEELNRMVLNYLEVTVTSEMYLRKAARAKRKQYTELMEIAQTAGLKPLLHTLSFGGRGWIPHETRKSLLAMGIPTQEVDKLTVWIGRKCKEYSVKLSNTRRQLESQPEIAEVSGQIRMRKCRKMKRSLGLIT